MGVGDSFFDDIQDNKDMLKIYLKRVPHPNRLHLWYLKINDIYHEGKNQNIKEPDHKVNLLTTVLDDITSDQTVYRQR